MYCKGKITFSLYALRYTGATRNTFSKLLRRNSAKFILPRAMEKKRGKIAAALKAAAGYWTAGRRCEDLFLNFAARSRHFTLRSTCKSDSAAAVAARVSLANNGSVRQWPGVFCAPRRTKAARWMHQMKHIQPPQRLAWTLMHVLWPQERMHFACIADHLSSETRHPRGNGTRQKSLGIFVLLALEVDFLFGCVNTLMHQKVANCNKYVLTRSKCSLMTTYFFALILLGK